MRPELGRQIGRSLTTVKEFKEWLEQINRDQSPMPNQEESNKGEHEG